MRTIKDRYIEVRGNGPMFKIPAKGVSATTRLTSESMLHMIAITTLVVLLFSLALASMVQERLDLKVVKSGGYYMLLNKGAP
jgi:uncharacterized membrane protein